MSILVTGASGVVGKDLINLLSTKYFVIATYRSKKKPYFKKNKNIKLLKMNLKKNFQN